MLGGLPVFSYPQVPGLVELHELGYFDPKTYRLDEQTERIVNKIIIKIK